MVRKTRGKLFKSRIQHCICCEHSLPRILLMIHMCAWECRGKESTKSLREMFRSFTDYRTFFMFYYQHLSQLESEATIIPTTQHFLIFCKDSQAGRVTTALIYSWLREGIEFRAGLSLTHLSLHPQWPGPHNLLAGAASPPPPALPCSVLLPGLAPGGPHSLHLGCSGPSGPCAQCGCSQAALPRCRAPSSASVHPTLPSHALDTGSGPRNRDTS